jgi:hypothetical protein
MARAFLVTTLAEVHSLDFAELADHIVEWVRVRDFQEAYLATYLLLAALQVRGEIPARGSDAGGVDPSVLQAWPRKTVRA